METARCPKHLVFDGRGFNHAGAGRSPGSCAYVSPATGEVLEIFAGKAVTVEEAYALLAIAGNPGMPPVRAEHGLLNGQGPLRLGQVVLVKIDFTTRGPCAKALWPTDMRTAGRSASVEKLGTISAVKAGFGFIRPYDGSPDTFFHFSELRGFTPLEGMTIRYIAKSGPDGRPQAGEIRRA